jgi:hypothetical protein
MMMMTVVVSCRWKASGCCVFYDSGFVDRYGGRQITVVDEI